MDSTSILRNAKCKMQNVIKEVSSALKELCNAAVVAVAATSNQLYQKISL